MRNRKKGFTLLELLVVIIIIGILATLALPRYTKTVNRFRWGECQINVANAARAYRLYFDVYTKYLSSGAAGVSTETTNSWAHLAVDNPNDTPGKKFQYIITDDDDAGTAKAVIGYEAAKATTFVATFPNYYMTLDNTSGFLNGAPDVFTNP